VSKGIILIGYDGDLRATLEAEGGAVIGYVALSPAESDLPYLGTDDTVARQALLEARLIIAADPPEVRSMLWKRYADLEPTGFVSERARIATTARISATATVQAGCLVSDMVTIGDNARINLDARLHHHCRVGGGTTIAPGARLLGGVTVGEDAYIGAGAIIRQNIAIGDGATVGMGSVVVRDVPPSKTVYGNPAKPASGGR